MVLCYITDRKRIPACSGSGASGRQLLLKKIGEAAASGIDLIQLREKDLGARELEILAREAVRIVHNESSRTRLLVNSRIDVAIAAAAHGVNLRSDDIPAGDARAIWAAAGCAETRSRSMIGVSCHTVEEVQRAAANGADFALFAPVFQKSGHPGAGLDALRRACTSQPLPGDVEGLGASQLPVLALGGVTLDNAVDCLQAGAAGIAGIRLFQENSLQSLVEKLRAVAQRIPDSSTARKG